MGDTVVPPGRPLTGALGERAAAAWLRRAGWQLLERNARTRYGEIDMVARDRVTLVFVESVSAQSLYGAEVGGWVEPVLSGVALEHAEHLEHAAHGAAVKTSYTVVVLGIFLALLLYVVNRSWPAKIAGGLGMLYETVRDKYYIDEAVDWVVIGGSKKIAAFLSLFDKHVIDGTVNLVGRTGRGLGFFAAWFDRTFVDGAVNGVGAITQVCGSAVRLLQSGRIQQYAAFAVAGGIAVAAWLILL